MSEIPWSGARVPAARPDMAPGAAGPANLADLLERILDKGIVIVGDIRVNLLDIELLTIKLRLLVASVDRAKEMGIDWWEHDPSLSSRARRRDDRTVTGARGQHAVDGEQALLEENRRLRERLEALEAGTGGDTGALPAGDATERAGDATGATDAPGKGQAPAGRKGGKK